MKTANILSLGRVHAGMCAAALLAVAEPGQPSPADITIGVSAGRITAPDSAAPGWSRIRVEEDGGGHIAVVFRVAPGVPASSMAAVLAELDSAAATPDELVALGGPEVGDTGEVVVRLTPGRYLIACVRRGADGHRHLHGGESRALVVRRGRVNPAHAKTPSARHVVRMVDFAFTGDEKWAGGPQLIRVENKGRQDHQIRILKLRDGSTMKDWVTAPNPGRHAVPVAGMARIGAGQVGYLPVDLSSGSYVAHCLVTDPKTKRPHMDLGMYRLITVE